MKLGQGGYGAVYKVQYKDHYFYSFITPMVHPRTCMLHNLLIHSYMPSAELGDHLHLVICVQGVLPNGNVVAVKQLFVRTAQGMDEFLNEVVLITGMKHRNLVNLKGCCLRENQRLLVYEYVDNYDVDQVLLGMFSARQAHAANTHFFVSRQNVHYLHLMACEKQVLSMKAILIPDY
jgi:serine/threonine protein kinase